MAKIVKRILFGLLIITSLVIIFIFVLYLKNPNFFKSSILVLKGAVLYSEKNLEDKAIEIYKRAEKIDPDNPVIYDAMARSYARKNLDNEAIGCLKKGIEKMPENEKFYEVILYFYISKNLHKEAVEYFKELLEESPQNKLAAKYLRLVQGFEILEKHIKVESKEETK